MASVIVTTSSFDTERSTALDELRRAGVHVLTNPHGRRLSASEVSTLLAGDIVGMIAGVEPLTRDVLSRARALKVISRCGVGIDNVDLDAATERGIKVYNTPQAPVDAVAELTVGLVLALLRRIAAADRGIRGGEWKPLMGSLLREQTVGVIGFGRIGRRVGELVHAFGARVLYHDSAAVAPTHCASGVALDALLERSDIVSLHLPLGRERESCIGRAELLRMKRGAFLVNTARGGLVDEDALLQALDSGQLAGAALDTFGEEPYHGALSRHSQVVLTAHMGSYAKEARVLMEKEAASNLLRGLAECGLLEAARTEHG